MMAVLMISNVWVNLLISVLYNLSSFVESVEHGRNQFNGKIIFENTFQIEAQVPI